PGAGRAVPRLLLLGAGPGGAADADGPVLRHARVRARSHLQPPPADDLAVAADTLLRVEDLTLHYRTQRGVVRAVDGVSFEVGRNEAMVMLGESGCGKTSLTKAL